MRSLLIALAGCGRLHFDPIGGPDDGAVVDGIGTTDGATAARFVQASALTSIASAASATAALPAQPQAGDLIVVFAWTWAQGATATLGMSAVTDNQGRTYTQAATQATGATGTCTSIGSAAIALYYTLAATPGAGSTVVTLVPTPSNQEIGLLVAEYAGVSALDRAASATSPSGASPYTFTSGTVVTTVPNELVVTVGEPCGGAPGTISWTGFGGFTARGTETDTSTHAPGIAADLVAATPGTVTDAWTITYTSSNNDKAIGAIAAFR